MPDDTTSQANKYDLRITQSVDDLRSNAKWTLVAFGAVGTTMLAGSQLSSIGKFPLDEPWLWLALGCAAAALIAATVAIGSAWRVATAGYVEIDYLTPADREFVTRNPALLEGFGTIDNLRAWYHFAIQQRFEALTQPQVDLHDLDNSEAWLLYLDNLVDNVTSFIHYNKIRVQSERSRSVLIVATVVSAVALLAFVWAANRTELPATVVLTSPTSEAVLTLTEAGKAALTPLLGKSCAANSRIEVIALSVAATGTDVVTRKTKDCPLVRFTVTDALGKLSSP
jgi:hypothetical protein